MDGLVSTTMVGVIVGVRVTVSELEVSPELSEPPPELSEPPPELSDEDGNARIGRASSVPDLSAKL
jgi:hypothetical protein